MSNKSKKMYKKKSRKKWEKEEQIHNVQQGKEISNIKKIQISKSDNFK